MALNTFFDWNTPSVSSSVGSPNSDGTNNLTPASLAAVARLDCEARPAPPIVETMTSMFESEDLSVGEE